MAYHRQRCTHPQLSDSSLIGQLTQQARHRQQSSTPHSHLQPGNPSLYYYCLLLLLLLLLTATTYYYYYCLLILLTTTTTTITAHYYLLLQAQAPDAEPLCARDQDARIGCRLTLYPSARSCTVRPMTCAPFARECMVKRSAKQNATPVRCSKARQGVPGRQQWLLPRHGCPAQQAAQHLPHQRPGPSS